MSTTVPALRAWHDSWPGVRPAVSSGRIAVKPIASLTGLAVAALTLSLLTVQPAWASTAVPAKDANGVATISVGVNVLVIIQATGTAHYGQEGFCTDSAGTVTVAYNDSYYPDNTGSYRVTVSVHGPKDCTG
jgi:hypothetical protein